MTVIKAAAVQLSPVLYSRDGTVDKVCRQILALGREGVQFATFPETVVPFYPYFSFVQPPSRMGAEHLRLQDLCKGLEPAGRERLGVPRRSGSPRRIRADAGPSRSPINGPCA